jgi:hypothetical protein
MSAVYSVCFLSQQGLTGTAQISVPSGHVYVVRDIDVYSGAISPSVVRFQDGNVGNTIWFVDVFATGANYASWRGRQVFAAGTIIQFEAPSAPFDLRVCGYDLIA